MIKRFTSGRGRGIGLALLSGLLLTSLLVVSAPAQPQRKRNPIADFFRRNFVPGGAADAPAADNEAGAEMKPRRQVSDQRAPYDPKHAEILRKVRTALAAKEGPAAVKLLRMVLDYPTDSIYAGQRGTWVSVYAEARRLLGELPPDLLEQYRQEYSGVAAQELAEAQKNGTLPALALVASRYFQTDAGFEAADLLITRHVERGEYGLAAIWCGELLAADAPLTRSLLWKTKAAWIAKLADDPLAESYLPQDLGTAKPQVTAPGAAPVEFQEWLNSAKTRAADPPTVLEDWPFFYGTARRTGVAAGGAPLLLNRWTQPTTLNSTILTQIEYMLEDLRDQGVTPLPTFFPLLVEGKVIFRSLHGVKVVDADTGRLLWETEDPLSAEHLLGGLQSDENLLFSQARFMGGPGMMGGGMVFGGGGIMFGGGGMGYSAGSADYHPLAHLIFRNSNFGLISAHEGRLFVVEDQLILSQRQPGQYWGEDASESDPYGRDWSSNRLAAYDLKNGRPLWEAGGPALPELAGDSLRGHYFLGAPVVSGDDLFLVGEKNNEIRLFALDPRTGAAKWEQLVAYSEAKIELDVGRQWWVSQPAIGDSVVVCPTTVGWIVGVDRIRRSLLWAHKYVAEQDKNQFAEGPAAQMVQVTPLNDRWAAAPPIIVGNRVLFSPPEENRLHCLHLYRGHEIWTRPREDYLYLAGVFGDRALLVGNRQVEAISMADGKSLWTCPLAGEGATGPRPSGRGVAVGQVYHLPLTGGQLWSLDLQTGKIVSQSYLPTQTHGFELGNLAMYRGMLISTNQQAVTAFEQREAVEKQIADALAQNPHDPQARVRQAEMLTLNRHYPAALASLRECDPAAIPEPLQERWRGLLRESLAAIIRSNFKEFDAEIAELGTLSRTDDERLAFRRLEAQRLVARKEFAAAFDAYLALGQESPSQMVELTPNGTTQVRADRWLSGKLQDLWQRLPDDQRTDLDARVELLADAASRGTPSERTQFATLFGFHPGALPIQHQRASEQVSQRDFLGAERIWMELRARPATRPEATLQLAQLMQEFKLPADAAWFYRQLEQEFATRLVRDQKSGADLVAELRATGKLPEPTVTPVNWNDADLDATRTGTNYSSFFVQDLSVQGNGLPFFRTHRMQMQQQEQWFRLDDLQGKGQDWVHPLRTRQNNSEEGFASLRVHGHQVILLHQGVLHCLSPVERKVIWTEPLDERPGSTPYYIQPYRQPMNTLQSPDQIRLMDQIEQRVAVNGPLCGANSRYVAYVGRRKLHVLDAATGQPIWTREGILPGTQFFGDEEVLYMITANRSQATALRGVDGAEILIPGLQKRIEKSMHNVGRVLVMVKSQGLREPVLEAYDPLHDSVVWERTVKNGLASIVTENRLALLEQTGEFHSLDLLTGQLLTLDKIPAAELRSRSEQYVFADFDNIYLVMNQNRNRNYFSDGLPAVQIFGTLHAYDPITGKERWKQSLPSHGLVLDRLDHLPILVLCNRKFERRGDNSGFWSFALTCLDKHTGRKVLDITPPLQNGFQSLGLDLRENYVELRSYNERLRVQPKTPTAAVTP